MPLRSVAQIPANRTPRQHFPSGGRGLGCCVVKRTAPGLPRIASRALQAALRRDAASCARNASHLPHRSWSFPAVAVGRAARSGLDRRLATRCCGAREPSGRWRRMLVTPVNHEQILQRCAPRNRGSSGRRSCDHGCSWRTAAGAASRTWRSGSLPRAAASVAYTLPRGLRHAASASRPDIAPAGGIVRRPHFIRRRSLAVQDASAACPELRVVRLSQRAPRSTASPSPAA